MRTVRVLLMCAAPLVSACGPRTQCAVDEDCLPWRYCSDEGECTDGIRRPPGTDDGPDENAASSSSSSSGMVSESTGASSMGDASSMVTMASSVVTTGSSSGVTPSCEQDERYVVIRFDEDEPVQAFRPSGNYITGIAPAGFGPGDGAFNLDGSTFFPRGGALIGDRILVSDALSIRALRADTWMPATVDGSQMYLPNDGPWLAKLGRYVMGFGLGIWSADSTAQRWMPVTHDGPGTDYSRMAKFTIGGLEHLVAVGDDAVELWIEGGTGPQLATSAENASRIGGYANTNFSRALAYDAMTDSLVVGHEGHALIFHPQQGMTVPSPSEDWLTPSEFDMVHAAAARDGIAYIATRSALLRVDLTQSPPATLNQVGYPSDSMVYSVVLGCRRVLVSSASWVKSFSLTELSPLGEYTGTDIRSVILTTKSELGLAGDQ